MKKICFLLIMFLLSSSLALSTLPAETVQAVRTAATYYVDADASGGTGLTWGTAFQTLQDALAVASSNDQIWVAEGVYYPDEGPTQTDNDRSASFNLKDSVAIYGGFEGTEDELSQRDWTTHITVLSGDIGQDDTTNADGVVEAVSDISGSNAYHIVNASSVSSSAILNGFTITAGYADGSACPGTGCGAGILIQNNASPTLANLILIANHVHFYGGGLAAINTTGATLTNITFTANEAQPPFAASYGGGAYILNSSLTLTNVTFEDNSAFYGGGLAMENASPTLSNAAFDNNTAQKGGGIFVKPNSSNNAGSPTLTDVTFTNNHANIPTIVSGVQTCNGGGGLCYYGSGTLNLTRVTFTNNDTMGLGGGFYLDNLGTTTLTDVDFSGNQCDYNGAGLFSANGTVTITGSDFENNQADYDGGGLGLDVGTMTISNTTFTNNSSRLGGGILLSEGSLTISNSSFTSNTSTTQGGGIFASWDSSLAISESTFTGNSSDYGGGIYCSVNQTLTMDHVTLTRNEANYDGGGLYNANEAALTHLRFYGNTASMSGGGFVNVYSDQTTLESAVFVGNQAAMNGGGVYNAIDDSDSFLLVNATFVDNHADSEGDGYYSYITGGSPIALNTVIANTIFWGSDEQIASGREKPVIRSCDIQGGFMDGTDIMDENPRFTQAPDPGVDAQWGTADDDYGDLLPVDYSPVLNQGRNADSTLALDLAGNPRIVDLIVDIGAYEIQNPLYRCLLPLVIR